MGAAMDYSQASTAEALMEHVHSQQFDHFSQVERQTLDSALAAAGIVLAAGPRVLDVGCGEGRLLRSWAARGAVCVGCDPSEALITAARAAQTGTKLPAIEYFTADATSDVLLPGAGTFDLVLSTYVFQLAHSEAQLQAMCNFLGRHARPGSGWALVLTVSGEYQPECRQCELMARLWRFSSWRVAGTQDQLEFVMGGGTSSRDCGSGKNGTDSSRTHTSSSSSGGDSSGGGNSGKNAGKEDTGVEERVLNFQYPAATYQRCLQRAGFEDVRPWPVRAPAALLEWAQQQQQQQQQQQDRGSSVPGLSSGSAGTDAERAEVLLRYLTNPHVTGFLARRGGSS